VGLPARMTKRSSTKSNVARITSRRNLRSPWRTPPLHLQRGASFEMPSPRWKQVMIRPAHCSTAWC